MYNIRSAKRYTAFAEQGFGRPGLLASHSEIHSFLVLAAGTGTPSDCCPGRPEKFNVARSSAGVWAGNPAVTRSGVAEICEDDKNDEDNGANKMLFVYS